MVNPKYWCKAVNVTRCKRTRITWITRINVSGYSLKISWNAEIGSLTTVESSTALAQTVLKGFGWPCNKWQLVQIQRRSPACFTLEATLATFLRNTDSYKGIHTTATSVALRSEMYLELRYTELHRCELWICRCVYTIERCILTKRSS